MLCVFDVLSSYLPCCLSAALFLSLCMCALFCACLLFANCMFYKDNTNGSLMLGGQYEKSSADGFLEWHVRLFVCASFEFIAMPPLFSPCIVFVRGHLLLGAALPVCLWNPFLYYFYPFAESEDVFLPEQIFKNFDFHLPFAWSQFPSPAVYWPFCLPVEVYVHVLNSVMYLANGPRCDVASSCAWRTSHAAKLRVLCSDCRVWLQVSVSSITKLIIIFAMAFELVISCSRLCNCKMCKWMLCGVLLFAWPTAIVSAGMSCLICSCLC